MDLNNRRYPGAVSRGVMLAILVLAVWVGACAPKEEDKEDSKRLNVAVSGDAATLAIGRAVVVLHVAMNSCSGSATSGIRHTADKDIANAGGPVTVSFTLSTGKYPNAYLETYFIDVDNSNKLSNGDIVWGTNSNDLGAVCIDTITGRPTNDFFDWEDIAGLFGGTSVWTDGTQPFSTQDAEADEDLGGIPMSFIPLERSFSELAQ